MVNVVVGALVREGRVLLGHRSHHKHAFPGVWDLPGGVVEPGETEPEALERELREELGVAIDPVSTSHLCRITVRPSGEPVVLSAWLVREWEGTPVNAAPEEHDEIAWCALEDLPPLAHPHVREAVVDAAGE